MSTTSSDLKTPPSIEAAWAELKTTSGKLPSFRVLPQGVDPRQPDEITFESFAILTKLYHELRNIYPRDLERLDLKAAMAWRHCAPYQVKRG